MSNQDLLRGELALRKVKLITDMVESAVEVEPNSAEESQLEIPEGTHLVPAEIMQAMRSCELRPEVIDLCNGQGRSEEEKEQGAGEEGIHPLWGRR